MTDAEHAAVLRRWNGDAYMLENDDLMAAIERAIELLERLADEMTPNLDEIRAALAAATPMIQLSPVVANAPTWLAALCDEVERLRAENADLAMTKSGAVLLGDAASLITSRSVRAAASEVLDRMSEHAEEQGLS